MNTVSRLRWLVVRVCWGGGDSEYMGMARQDPSITGIGRVTMAIHCFDI